jgi:dynein heavy chain
MTARDKQTPLELMTYSMTVMPFAVVRATTSARARSSCAHAHDHMALTSSLSAHIAAQVTAQPDEGAYIHGLFMEGALWDGERGSIVAAKGPLEMLTPMPVIQIKGIVAPGKPSATQYSCPTYTSRLRGDGALHFAALLPTLRPTATWAIAGVCLLMQSE